MDDKVALLSEISRLIHNAPPVATFYHDLPENHIWLGEVSNALHMWDPVRSAGLSITIGGVLNHTVRNHGERQSLIVLLTSARRSLQMALSIASSPYTAPREPERTQLTIELGQLREALTQSNTIDPNDREILLAEIAVFEASLVQPQLSTELVYRFVGGVLKSAAIRLAGATADEIAARIGILALGMIAAGA